MSTASYHATPAPAPADNIPLAWHCRSSFSGEERVTTIRATMESLEADDWVITPLYRRTAPAPSLPASTGAEDTKVCQAYQVIGSLLDRCGMFDSPEGQRALDYFCAGNEADENFLPWPREPFSSSASTGAEEEAERRYPAFSIMGAPDGVPFQERIAFCDGAAWQASQSALSSSTGPERHSIPPLNPAPQGYSSPMAARCDYPNCNCAVSFPEGYKPSPETECPRAGDTVAVKREWLEELSEHLRFDSSNFSLEISRLLDGRHP